MRSGFAVAVAARGRLLCGFAAFAGMTVVVVGVLYRYPEVWLGC